MADLGKALVVVGVLIVALGALLLFGDHIPWLGRLPGDIVVHRDRFTLYFPLATCLVLSVLLSLIVFLLRR